MHKSILFNAAPTSPSPPPAPKHPTGGYNLYLSDPSMTSHFEGSDLYNITPSIEFTCSQAPLPRVDVAVVSAASSRSGRSLASPSSWPYLYALACGARIFDPAWPADPERDAKAASFLRSSSSSSAPPTPGLVYGHENCQSLGGPARMFKMAQRGRKKR